MSREKELSDVLTTPGQLADALKLSYLANEPEQDIKKLKYVLYVRKSTSGDEKQERSLEDQIADCIEMQVKKNELNLIEVIQEKESAKSPGIRPKFKQMLADIQKGKYDSVIAWHPDRLARNMKDAGEIIYLLEENIIKDLRFATFTFENSPMGKMLLGMSFVLSKQYSDHLSEQVVRGQKRRIEEGVSISVPKQGYRKDVNKRFRPDEDNGNWNLIKEAFVMRLSGKGYDEIVKFLKDNKYSRAPAIGKERNSNYKITKNTLTDLFTDPFYAGVYQFGKQFVALTEVDSSFTPMISVQDYCKLNNFTFNGIEFVTKASKSRSRTPEKLLRGVIRCSECDSDMVSGITVKHNKKTQDETRYYMFRCNNPDCKVYNKSFRSKIALEFIYDYFAKCDFTTRQMYNQLIKEKTLTTEQVKNKLESSLRSLTQQKTQRIKTYKRTKEIVIENDPKIMKHFKGELDEIQNDITEIDSEIKETKNQISNIEGALPTYEKYFELFKDMVKILKNTSNMQLKDQIVRKYFLNLYLKAEKTGIRKDGKPVFSWIVSDYKLSPNYEKLLLVRNGTPDRI